MTLTGRFDRLHPKRRAVASKRVSMTQTRRPKPTWIVVGTLSLSGILAALQHTMIIAQLPEVPVLYSVSPDDTSWVITITLLTGAIATPILARLADMYGKKLMIVVSMLTLVVGSLVAVLPLGFGALIVGRGLQGTSAALIPIAMSIMRDELPKERLGFGIALMGATLGVGGAVGMPLSGVLSETLGFESLFWLSALLGAVTVLAVVLVVRESPVRTRGRFDVLGAFLLTLALTGLLLGISKGATWGWASPPTLIAFGTAIVLFAVWLPTQLRTPVPMVDLRTAVRRPVLLTNISSFAGNAAMFVNLLVTAQQLQQPEQSGGFGLDPMTAGLAMFPPALTWLIMSPISGVLLNRIGARATLLLGSVLLVGAYLFRVLMRGSIAEVVIGSSLVHVGAALTFAAIPAIIMASVPITETASANGLNSLVRAIGSAVSSAVVGGVLAAVAVTIDGVEHPRPEAFLIVIAFAFACSVLALVIACFIPRLPRETDGEFELAGGEGIETVVQGRVLPGGRAPQEPVVVAVHALDGTQLDWSRSDLKGNYSIVVPGPGSYRIVANAAGWQPIAELIDVVEGSNGHHFELDSRLTVNGTVTIEGLALERALVSLTGGDGREWCTARTDADGRYCLPLPPSGPYLLRASDGDRTVAAEHRVIVHAESLECDFDLERAR